VIPSDLDGDGFMDLLVIVVYTEYEEISFDRVEGFVQLTEVVPALSERRELRAYLGRPDGNYRLAGESIELPLEVSAMSGGPPGMPVIALTQDGAAAVRLERAGGNLSLGFHPFITEPPVLRGSRSFLSELDLVGNLDGDEDLDLLFPARTGPAVFRGKGGGFSTQPADRLVLPGDERGSGAVVWRRYPLARVQDVDGDALPDLVPGPLGSARGGIEVVRGAGEGRFHPARKIDLRCLEPGREGDVEEEGHWSSDLIYFGDLDGDGGAEIVLQSEMETEDGGLKEARKPRSIFRFYRLRDDITVEPEPYFEMDGEGYPFGGQWAGRASEPFRDLDGDGRKELITVNLDFSLFQVLRLLTTKRLGIGLDFNIWRQGADGGFTAVDDLKLSDKILLDLNDLKLDRLGNFAGDFDGDGLPEFLAMKGGRTLELHRGMPGCEYAGRPDFKLRLAEEPQDPGLVKVKDLDGDGKADLAVTRLLKADPSGATTPVSLDLYLSGGSP
jgi:hypothetical protein